MISIKDRSMFAQQKEDFFHTAIVVNDDVTQLKFLTGLLTKTGITVSAFETAETALMAMEENHLPDLIVTDLYMPGIDGWRFCRLLRSPEYAAFNDVPILVVSATFSGDEAARITADLGANAFLSSPVDGLRFSETVKSILTRQQPKDQLRVLIVEDSRSQANFIRKAFEQHGYLVKSAVTLATAAALLECNPFDVAVIDYHLPDGKGDALLPRFRMIRPDLIFIMMTTDPLPQLALKWMRQGAADYLKKPFDPEYLVELCVRARRERSLLRVEDLLEERTRELRESKTRYQTLVEDLNEIIYRLDDQAVITYVSPSIETMSGYKPEEIIGRNFLEFVHPRDLDGRIEQYRKIMSGIIESSEYRFLDKKGQAIWITTSARPLIENGKTTGIQGVLMDITERRQAQEKLREQRLRLESIVKGTNAATWEWNIQTGQLIVNRIWAQMIGCTLEELHPCTIETWKTLVHPEDMNPCAAILERHLAGELSYYECEYRMKHKDGYWVEIHDRGRIVTRTTEGKPLSMFGFHLDITERKQAEAKIFHLQKEESLGRMAGAVAHHYNNLIQIIAGNLELVQEKLPENSGSAGNLADAMHAARRASNMGGMMLAYLGHTVARHENLELSGTCRGFLSSFIANMPAHVTLAADLSKPGLIVNANAGHIRQILEILISNASESVKEQSGSVFLSIRKSASVDIPTDHRYPVDFLANPSDYACLEVRDTGEGILQKNLEKIFDPFYSTRFTGRGLGLPIVLGTIKTHQGCMTVATMPGKGSTFRVYLPLIREKQYDQY